jgi:hypothetical protein
MRRAYGADIVSSAAAVAGKAWLTTHARIVGGKTVLGLGGGVPPWPTYGEA